MGVKRKFINECGNIEHIDMFNPGFYKNDDCICLVENDKTVYEIEAPFDQFQLINVNKNLDMNNLNNDPEKLDHYLCKYLLTKP